ncbi:MAG: filamentous hemagglutinin N-terminal domain-containing protein, partial [Rhodoferax sp.]|nr:filamentous hemagglutinin N-terminal domain-containing protein [Rhodoferax sp.]
MKYQQLPTYTTARLHPPYRRTAGWLVAMAAVGAIANPQSPQVVNGQASFATNGATLTVTNTPGAIIHWQSFGINRGELTRFVQQNAASAVLNRVTGTDPSNILGALQSNGRVFLINPNGIVFGRGSQVDVAGLVVSSLKMSDPDFLAGRLRFTDTPGAGEVRVEGNIRTASGGQVILVAPRVANSGLIEAPNGVILLAAGRSVEISDIDRPSIRVEISNSNEEAVNVGTLIARHISIYGGLVRNSGTILANSAVVGEGGRVTLRGKQAVVLTPTSVIEANGPSGGTVLIESEGMTQVQGSISARAVLPMPALPLPTMETAAPLVNPASPVQQAPSATNTPTAAAPARTPAATPVLEPVAAPSASSDGAAPAVSPSGGLALAAAAPVLTAATSAANSLSPPLSATVPPPSDPLAPQRPAPQTPALPVAPAPAVPQAPASGNGIGGSIRVLGRSVSVGDDARLDASGPLGGGEILVGGGWQGLNPNIITSNFT